MGALASPIPPLQSPASAQACPAWPSMVQVSLIRQGKGRASMGSLTRQGKGRASTGSLIRQGKGRASMGSLIRQGKGRSSMGSLIRQVRASMDSLTQQSRDSMASPTRLPQVTHQSIRVLVVVLEVTHLLVRSSMVSSIRQGRGRANTIRQGKGRANTIRQGRASLVSQGRTSTINQGRPSTALQGRASLVSLARQLELTHPQAKHLELTHHPVSPCLIRQRRLDSLQEDSKLTLRCQTPMPLMETNPMGLLAAAVELISIIKTQAGSSHSSRLTQVSRVTAVITLRILTWAVVTLGAMARATQSPAMVPISLGLGQDPRDMTPAVMTTTSMARGAAAKVRGQGGTAGLLAIPNTVSLERLPVPSTAKLGCCQIPSTARLLVTSIMVSPVLLQGQMLASLGSSG